MTMRLFTVLLLLSGCTAPREAFRDLPDPYTLDEVNALLAGETVTVVLADGERIENAHAVTVGRDTVRFAAGRRARDRRALPTAAVERITAVRGRGTRYGAAAGSIPGVLAVLSSIGSSQSVREGERAAGTSTLTLAVPAILAGAAFGAWIGQLTTPGETVVLYRSPVSRYPPSPSDP